MHYYENTLYHIYNRSINKELLFRSHNDYLKLLEMVRTHLYEKVEILSWCLMPNHFHFLLRTTEKSVELRKVGGLQIQSLQYGIKNLLSSYCKSYNHLYQRSGNLFQQKTKAKEVNAEGRTVFHYIHQNPWKAKLVGKPEEWEYSSLKDYLNMRSGTLCFKEESYRLLDLNKSKLYEETYQSVSNELIIKLKLEKGYD